MNSKIVYHRSGMVFNVKGSWPEQSKLLQQTFPEMTDDNMKLISDIDHDLLERIDNRLALSKGEVMKTVSKASLGKTMQVHFRTRRNLTHRN